jgi:hypothetical protein
MNTLERIRSGRSAQRAAAVTATTVTAAAVAAASPLGNLTAHFGLSWSDATKIVAAVATGGTAILLLFPAIIPVVGTIELIIATAGTGAAIGW